MQIAFDKFEANSFVKKYKLYNFLLILLETVHCLSNQNEFKRDT